MENVCILCRGIFTGTKRVVYPIRRRGVSYYHHRTLTSLEAAVEDGCDICKVLSRNILGSTREDRKPHIGSDFAVSYELHHYKFRPDKYSVFFYYGRSRSIVEFFRLGQHHEHIVKV
jgi:hypothetical protein